MSGPAEPAAPLEEVRTFMRGLLGGLPDGGEIAGWKLLHVSVDEALGYHFEGPDGRVELTLAPRNDAAPHYAQTASFNVTYSVARLQDRPLTEGGASLVQTVARTIARHDRGDAAARFSARTRPGTGEVTRIRVESLLCPVSLDGHAYYTANPYIGCLIGCSFCYAQSHMAVVRRMARLDDIRWGSYVMVKENAPEVLERELASMPARPVVFSPLVADVYQSVERRELLTRRCLEVLARRGVRAYILTRSDLVLRDLDLLARIPGATVGFSISTDDDDVGRAYEPRAALISERFLALARLKAAGIGTVAVVQPLLPMNVEALADRLAQVCDAVRVDVYSPPDLGGAPLRAAPGSQVPAPPDQPATRAAVVSALEKRGVRLWTTHVPP